MGQCEEVRDAGAQPIRAAAAAEMGECGGQDLGDRVGGGQSSHSICFRPEHVQVARSGLSPLLLQPERWNQSPFVSTGVGCDWLQAALPTTHSTHPAHLFKMHTHSQLLNQFSSPWLQGGTHWKSVRFFFPFPFLSLSLPPPLPCSLRDLLLPIRNAAYLKQSHDFTGSQNDPRGLLSGERERKKERERETVGLSEWKTSKMSCRERGLGFKQPRLAFGNE